MVFAAPSLAETPAAGAIDQRAARVDKRRDDTPAFSDSLSRETSRNQPREPANSAERPAPQREPRADEAEPAAEVAPAPGSEPRTPTDKSDRTDAQPVRSDVRGQDADNAQSTRPQAASIQANKAGAQAPQPGVAPEAQTAGAMAAPPPEASTTPRPAHANTAAPAPADAAAQPAQTVAIAAGAAQGEPSAAAARPATGQPLSAGLTVPGEADAAPSTGGQAQQQGGERDQPHDDTRAPRPVLDAFLARSAGRADASPAPDAAPAQPQPATAPPPDAGAQAARAAVSTSIENQGAIHVSKAPAAPPPPPGAPQGGGEGAQEAQTLASVSRGLAAAVRQRGGSVTIRLMPESLGALRIQMSIHNGSVSIRFEAASDQARDLLHRHADTLRQTLEQKGFGVERIQVQTSQTNAQDSRSHAQHDAQDQGRHRPEHDAAGGRSKGSFDRRDADPNHPAGGAPEEEPTFFERWSVSVNTTA